MNEPMCNMNLTFTRGFWADPLEYFDSVPTLKVWGIALEGSPLQVLARCAASEEAIQPHPQAIESCKVPKRPGKTEEPRNSAGSWMAWQQRTWWWWLTSEEYDVPLALVLAKVTATIVMDDGGGYGGPGGLFRHILCYFFSARSMPHWALKHSYLEVSFTLLFRSQFSKHCYLGVSFLNTAKFVVSFKTLLINMMISSLIRSALPKHCRCQFLKHCFLNKNTPN
jgi:hypothetical protein